MSEPKASSCSSQGLAPLILVVDDTEGTRYSVARVLKNDGFRVIEAATGTDGLRLAFEQLPDLSILDIHLPDMLGFEVCRRLKAAPRTAIMPVLQISASYVTAKDRVTGLEGGADSYLTHPVEPQVLIATVRALLRLRDLNRKMALTDERLELALKAAPITLFELDLDLRNRWAHFPNSETIQTGLIGRRIDEIFPTDESRALLKLQQDAIATGEPRRAIYKNTLDGIERFYDIRLEPMKDPSGQVRGLIGVGVDVTERERSKLEIEHARDAAESANQAKSQFIANISHEIRTPLGVIMGFSDLILDSGPNHDENLKSVGIIKRNAVQLSKLIDEVLDLSKVEADHMEIEAIRFDLVDVVEDVISLLSLSAREKGIKLSAQYRGQIPATIKTDPSRLRQILINMVGNAVKFTQHGHVKLTVASNEVPVVGQPLTLHFEVEDTGIGMSAEHEAKLFTAFSQADASMTRRFGGTGLGLMLSKKLAQALGGDLVLLKSAMGEGSTFRATVTDPGFQGSLRSIGPDGRATVLAPVTKPQATIERVLEGATVLLVEDSPDNQLMIQRFLSQAGAEVELASNGTEGIVAAEQKPHDIILMDIQMPELDGYEATKQLRARGFSGTIIALTAHALKGEREKCLAAGFTDYLTKPVNRQGLIAKIQEHRL